LVGPNGEQVGIVRIEDALRLAQEADLDLVEVAAQARPPVCKLMDFGKFKYETAQKARESRRNQQMTVIKEQKLRPKIDAHDYETKKRHVVRFLDAGHKVKVASSPGRSWASGCCSGSPTTSLSLASWRPPPSKTAGI
jgi:translation initiation factor IF-3